MGGPFFFILHRGGLTVHAAQASSYESDEVVVSEMRFEDVIMLPKAREDFYMCLCTLHAYRERLQRRD